MIVQFQEQAVRLHGQQILTTIEGTAYLERPTGESILARLVDWDAEVGATG